MFGGKYRIIDFPLSNCRNSGIDTVGILTQYQPLELNWYIGNGSSWNLDSTKGGTYVLPPYQSDGGSNWYRGTADAIYQNLNFVEMVGDDYVLILSGDHIYSMDYDKMLNFHKKHHAKATIGTIRVPWDEASRFGIMVADENMRITKFQENRPNRKATWLPWAFTSSTGTSWNRTSKPTPKMKIGTRLRQERHPGHAGRQDSPLCLSL